MAFFAAWGGQAVAAYRTALARGWRPGGAIAILALAPLAVVVFTAFWLVAGATGSPAATLQRYLSAWHHGRPAEAAGLFVQPREPARLVAAWRADDAYLRTRLLELSASLGPTSGLDPDEPFAALVVEIVEPPGVPAGRATAALAIVRRERVRETLFGLIPTAAQRDVVVERVGTARLEAVPSGALELPLRGRSWLLRSVEMGPGE